LCQPIPLGSPAGFPAPLPSGGASFVGRDTFWDSVMRNLYGLPFDLEKLFQSVRRFNGVRQTDQPDPELLDFVESNWPYLLLAKHRK